MPTKNSIKYKSEYLSATIDLHKMINYKKSKLPDKKNKLYDLISREIEVIETFIQITEILTNKMCEDIDALKLTCVNKSIQIKILEQELKQGISDMLAVATNREVPCKPDEERWQQIKKDYLESNGDLSIWKLCNSFMIDDHQINELLNGD